jgi:hypothetical protein
MTVQAVAHDRQNIQVNEQLDIDVRAVAHDAPVNGLGKEEQTTSGLSPTTGHLAHTKAFIAEHGKPADGAIQRWFLNQDCPECWEAAEPSIEWDNPWASRENDAAMKHSRSKAA